MMERVSVLRVLLLVIGIALAFSVSVQIEPRTKHCYYEKSQGNEWLFVDFTVTRGGLLDVRLKVTDPRGASVHEELHIFQEHTENRELMFHTAFEGTYSICFDNEMSRFTAKVVRFHTSVHRNQDKTDKVKTSKDKKELLKAEHLKPVEQSIQETQQTLKNIHDEQLYMRTREQVHRDTQESTFRRVYFFSFLESAVLLGMAAFQIFQLKRWFENQPSMRGF
eukprot:TRINITY_DN26472_c0_g1_i1.p1 TRINITY_DN26472_c0_g1~~TRINITY_DN26472_c0_g1_i1.p1  ORF type:complete len:222 (-),score=38.83 TRINITY_DN26472_c0_g1_i1:34-699(-)